MNVLRMFGIATLAAIGLAVATSPVVAQRGVGEQQGVAQMPVKPEIVALTGKITAINVGPCEHTTGHALIGAHLLIEPAASAGDPDSTVQVEPLNIHVGPAAVVQDMLAKFPIGAQVTVEAFRTDKMPANHYTAQSIKTGDVTVTFRDESLRPVWAGTRGGGNGARSTTANGPRYGRGYGQGRGYRNAGRPCWRMTR